MSGYVVEADGGSRGNPGPAAYGTVVKEAATGVVLREIAEHIGTASNNVAEYRGLIAGLEAVRELDPTATVEARLDSKLVVEQMSGRWQLKHPGMRALAQRARAVLPPGNVTYLWVPRERNRHADRLANEALDAAARGQAWSPGASTAEVRAAELGATELGATELGATELGATDAATRAGLADADDEAVQPTARASLVGWDSELGVPTTTVLLRHGETAHTAQRRFSGSAGRDPALSEQGERQAAAVADRLAAAGGVDVVLSSPMRRTRQTAEVVAVALGVPVREVEAFQECAFGQWEGLTLQEVRADWASELDRWLADPAVAPPGGESFTAVRRRVTRARDQLLARYPRQTVLVVTHVTPIKVLVADALRAPLAALYRMELTPATLTELAWFESGPACLRRFNDAAHLH